MSLVVIGTVAFDAIETPFGKTDKIVGGAATYASLAASYFYDRTKIVAVVGDDFPQDEIEVFTKHHISTEGLQVKKGEKSFFWSGVYHLDMNTRDTLVTDLNVLTDFNPVLPESYQNTDYLFLGNIAPALQKSVILQLKKRPKFILLDTMNFWMDIALNDLHETLKLVDALVVNDSEARQLTGEYSMVKAAKKILSMGPKYLVIKRGEFGALLFYNDKIFFAPGLPLEEVFDPTGAGDSFAGGFIGYLAKVDDLSFESMKTAIIMGSITASFCVEKLGTDGVRNITKEDIKNRERQFVELTKFEIY